MSLVCVKALFECTVLLVLQHGVFCVAGVTALCECPTCHACVTVLCECPTCLAGVTVLCFLPVLLVLQHCVNVLPVLLVLQHCVGVLPVLLVLQHCVGVLPVLLVLQHCVGVLPVLLVLQHCVGVLPMPVSTGVATLLECHTCVANAAALSFRPVLQGFRVLLVDSSSTTTFVFYTPGSLTATTTGDGSSNIYK